MKLHELVLAVIVLGAACNYCGPVVGCAPGDGPFHHHHRYRTRIYRH